MKIFFMRIIIGFFFMIFIISGAVWAAETAGITVIVTLESAGNNPPVLDPIGNNNAAVGRMLNLNITASDPDGDILIFDIINQPAGSEFRMVGDHARFRWRSTADQIGTHEVTFVVTDSGEPPLSDSEAIIITVE